MTIEDAVVLAEELSLDPGLDDGERIGAALSAYEARRLPRTKAVVDLSWKLSKVYNWKNPVASRLRNAMLFLTPAFVDRRRFQPEIDRDL